MRKAKSLKECRNADEAQRYIIEHDGLSDEDFEDLTFVEVGPDEDVAEIIPVPLDSETARKVRKIAKDSGKTPDAVLRDWATNICRHDFRLKKQPSSKQPKKRATG